jgi:hypothetical protein
MYHLLVRPRGAGIDEMDRPPKASEEGGYLQNHHGIFGRPVRQLHDPLEAQFRNQDFSQVMPSCDALGGYVSVIREIRSAIFPSLWRPYLGKLSAVCGLRGTSHVNTTVRDRTLYSVVNSVLSIYGDDVGVTRGMIEPHRPAGQANELKNHAIPY